MIHNSRECIDIIELPISDYIADSSNKMRALDTLFSIRLCFVWLYFGA